MMASFYEFFAGGGMVRAGLGPEWKCLFANDIDPKKRSSYTHNWGDADLKAGSVADLTTRDLPGQVDLAWASFPCQDLSLAGDYAGLKGERSGTLWPFWRLMQMLRDERRSPSLIALENVCGALTSHGGRDFAAIGEAFASAGYRFGAMIIDAIHFLPQSRPRLFIIGAHPELQIPERLTRFEPDSLWHSAGLVKAYGNLSTQAKEAWLWWRVPAPPTRTTVFADLVEDQPDGVSWHTATQTRQLLSLMSHLNHQKVETAQQSGRKTVGCIYKRTRPNDSGEREQRAEIRFDNVAGCLRTPGGGSSRQIIMVIEGEHIRSRLLSPRETARLMGLPDTYRLPSNYNDAYHLTGDGVAVPVVRHLAKHILEPLTQRVPVGVVESAA